MTSTTPLPLIIALARAGSLDRAWALFGAAGYDRLSDDPQAIRVIVPPTGNEVISMLKNTSLASVVAYTELLYSVQLIYSANYKTIPLLIVASIWYLIMTSVLYVGQYFIERRYGRGFTRAERATMRERWVGFSSWHR